MTHRILLSLILFSFTTARAEVAVSSSRPTASATPAAPPTEAEPSSVSLEVNGDYELRGFFGTGDMLEVSVSKKGAPVSDWIPVGRKRGELKIVSASPKEGVAVILVGGKRSLLRLEGSKAGSAKLAESSEITEADLKEAQEYMDTLMENMTDEQRKVWRIDFIKRLEQNEVLSEASRRMGRGIIPTKAEADYQMSLSVPMMAQSLAKAMELPSRDGVVHPLPRSLDRVVKSPEALKRFYKPEGDDKEPPQK